MLEVWKKCPLNCTHKYTYQAHKQKKRWKRKVEPNILWLSGEIEFVLLNFCPCIAAHSRVVNWLVCIAEDFYMLSSFFFLFMLLLLELNWKCGYWGSGMSRICAIKLEKTKKRKTAHFEMNTSRQSAVGIHSNSLYSVLFLYRFYLFQSTFILSIDLE